MLKTCMNYTRKRIVLHRLLDGKSFNYSNVSLIIIGLALIRFAKAVSVSNWLTREWLIADGWLIIIFDSQIYFHKPKQKNSAM